MLKALPTNVISDQLSAMPMASTVNGAPTGTPSIFRTSLSKELQIHRTSYLLWISTCMTQRPLKSVTQSCSSSPISLTRNGAIFLWRYLSQKTRSQQGSFITSYILLIVYTSLVNSAPLNSSFHSFFPNPIAKITHSFQQPPYKKVLSGPVHTI